MSLTPGTRLGPYEILTLVGAGGMGEVYKARDTRLDRIVAIKVLRQPAATAEVAQQFTREARAIAQLTHPHICTLYDVGRHGDIDYLVMEYLDGETLASRLTRGRLTIAQALTVGGQIADALDQAHRRGILHRDLKPGNVILTASGAKLVDFGLARTLARTPFQSAEPAEASTAETAVTAGGMVIGTLPYMAPEVLEGGQSDARADIWAFGCVLYEMLAGLRAFSGNSQASLVGAILKDDPPRLTTEPLAPPALDRVVRACLAKDPDDRVQSVRDLALNLRWIDEGASPSAGLAAPLAHRRRQIRVAGVGFAVGATLMAAGWWIASPRPRAQPVRRFAYSLPASQQLTHPGRHDIAISPDGSLLAYIANSQIYLRRLSDLDAQPVRGTAEDPLDLIFSPDGRWIAYFVQRSAPPTSKTSNGTVPAADWTLMKAPVSGGAPVVLATIGGYPFGATWGGGRILVGRGPDGIVAVPEGGGQPVQVVTVDKSRHERAATPQVIDGGRQVLFSLLPSGATDWSSGEIVVEDVRAGQRRVVLTAAHDARVLSSGYLVFARGGTVFAAPFDPRRAERTGDPVAAVVGVAEIAAAAGGGPAQFAVSEEGQLAYVARTDKSRYPLRPLVWVDREGRESPIAASPHEYVAARVSNDGTRFALDVREDDRSTWIWDVPHGVLSRLPAGTADNWYSTWMPDNRTVVYHAGVTPEAGAFFKRAADGTSAPLRIADGDGMPASISPDGRFLVYWVSAHANADLWILPLSGGPAQPLIATPAAEMNASISPDGRWIAYQSDETGRFEVYVRPFPAVNGGRWRVSTAGGSQPVWSRSGQELYYAGLDRRMTAVSVTASATFNYGKATPLFDLTPYLVEGSGNPGRSFDVAADGRFLLIRRNPLVIEPTTIVIIDHWGEDLKSRLGR